MKSPQIAILSTTLFLSVACNQLKPSSNTISEGSGHGPSKENKLESDIPKSFKEQNEWIKNRHLNVSEEYEGSFKRYSDTQLSVAQLNLIIREGFFLNYSEADELSRCTDKLFAFDLTGPLEYGYEEISTEISSCLETDGNSSGEYGDSVKAHFVFELAYPLKENNELITSMEILHTRLNIANDFNAAFSQSGRESMSFSNGGYAYWVDQDFISHHPDDFNAPCLFHKREGEQTTINCKFLFLESFGSSVGNEYDASISIEYLDAIAESYTAKYYREGTTAAVEINNWKGTIVYGAADAPPKMILANKSGDAFSYDFEKDFGDIEELDRSILRESVDKSIVTPSSYDELFLESAHAIGFDPSDESTIYLGCWSCPPGSDNAISNSYSSYGNPNGKYSLANSSSAFVLPSSNQSICNHEATHPPQLWVESYVNSESGNDTWGATKFLGVLNTNPETSTGVCNADGSAYSLSVCSQLLRFCRGDYSLLGRSAADHLKHPKTRSGFFR